ncbi:MAG: cation:proton antiporter [Gemmatimonadaceae bacterium]
MEQFLSTLALIGIVLIAAALLSSALERAGVPIAAVFLALGALIGPLGLDLLDVGFHSPALHVLGTLGLALVLFSDAVTIRIAELRAQWRLVWRVLGPGTLIPAILIAVAAWLLLGVPPAGAAILGAALASTDPVLLRGVMRSPALPPPARLALRIETGMNDVVLLPIVVLAMLALRAPASGVAARDVVRSVLGLFLLGPLLGAAVGWTGIAALTKVRARVGVRRDYESLYALGLAFTAYAAAEAVGGSGFVAAFVAGLMVALQDTELCDCFLEYGEATAEMLLLLTFVALGTSLIWLGLAGIDWRLVAFACIALGIRTVVLYPILIRAGMQKHDRTLVALFGARGLSSLLLVLLPVFAGLPGSERLFVITSFVVLLSVVLHGGGMGLFDRRHRRAAAPAPVLTESAPLPIVEAPHDDVPERITIDEMRALQARGEPIVIVDTRANRNYDADSITATGAVRVSPDDPVRDATALRLSQRSTLVIYCA